MAKDKLLLLLAARGGIERKELGERLRAEMERLHERLPDAGRSVQGWLRIEDDPFAQGGPPMRAFDATLELRCAKGKALRKAVDDIGARLEGILHTDLSAALQGTDHALQACAPTPVRYQYVMRRRADLSHAQYADHYLNKHARFGVSTPGIEGYVQFHVDPEASRRAAEKAGLGLWAADSVSELQLESTRKFIEAVASWPLRAEATQDEELFVDRINSVMFCSERI